MKRFELIAEAMHMMPRSLLRAAIREAVKERINLQEVAKDPRVRVLITSGSNEPVVQMHAYENADTMAEYERLVEASGYTKSFAAQVAIAWYITKRVEIEIPSEAELAEVEA